MDQQKLEFAKQAIEETIAEAERQNVVPVMLLSCNSEEDAAELFEWVKDRYPDLLFACTYPGMDVGSLYDDGFDYRFSLN
jgi:hypothetical protein